MRKFLLVCFFFLATIKAFGQQFSLYNTGTLYDSFENPSQRAFIPDTTKQFAFNFLIPNFNGNFFVTGNGQEALKTRAFHSYYNTADLTVGQGGFNRANVNLTNYSIMFKVFTSENGDQEMGVSLNTRAEGRALATDETIAFFNGFTNFPLNSYTDLFNSNYKFQAYHQLSFSYREQVDKRLSVGVKLSALAGIQYNELRIDQSTATFNKASDQASLAFAGSTRYSDNKGESNFSKVFPIFVNPGASVSLGVTYFDESGFKWQGNIKNVGFISWASKSRTNNFAGTALINGFSTGTRENVIKGAIDSVSQAGQSRHSFITPTNGLMELSINKTWNLSEDGDVRFSPTLIGSKELFYNGFTAALVAPVQFDKHSVALTTSYNELKLLNLGIQYLKKTDNAEFFIGSERLFQTVSFVSYAVKTQSDQKQVKTPTPSYTGLDFYIGASFKFGPLIERRMNSSGIAPQGDGGFFSKIWNGLFGKADPNY